MQSKKLLFSCLAGLFFMISFSVVAQNASNCRQIDATYKVVKDSLNPDLGAIEIKVGGSQSSVMKNLIGPAGFFLKDIKLNTITGLKHGTYSLVFVGRKEDDRMCPKSFQVIIK